MFVKEVTVENQVGLHARPATFFIQKANEFKSSIWVEKEERRVNAKSLLGVLSLGIVGGTTIRIIADGADEQGEQPPQGVRLKHQAHAPRQRQNLGGLRCPRPQDSHQRQLDSQEEKDDPAAGL